PASIAASALRCSAIRWWPTASSGPSCARSAKVRRWRAEGSGGAASESTLNWVPDRAASKLGYRTAKSDTGSRAVIASDSKGGHGLPSQTAKILDPRLSRDHARNVLQRISERPRVYVVEELSVEDGKARLRRRDPRRRAAHRPMCNPAGHLRATIRSGVGGKRSAGDEDE